VTCGEDTSASFKLTGAGGDIHLTVLEECKKAGNKK
jgi:hypothetical protein